MADDTPHGRDLREVAPRRPRDVARTVAADVVRRLRDMADEDRERWSRARGEVSP